MGLSKLGILFILVFSNLAHSKDARELISSHCFTDGWQHSIDVFYPDNFDKKVGKASVHVQWGADTLLKGEGRATIASNFPSFGQDTINIRIGSSEVSLLTESDSLRELPEYKYSGTAVYAGRMETDSTLTYTTPFFCSHEYKANLPSPNEVVYLPSQEIPQQVCRIEMYLEKEKNYLPVCSGTLIAKRTLLTAGHCILPSSYPVRVSCPNGESFFSDTYQNEIHDLYDDRNLVTVLKTAKNDIGLIFLNRKAKQEPISIVSSQAEGNDLILNSPDRCILAGYGNAAKEWDKKLHAVNYSFPPERFTSKADFLSTLYGGLILSDPEQFLRSGDSGGPILCKDRTNKWKVVGVHSIVQLNIRTSSASVGLNSKWIEQNLR